MAAGVAVVTEAVTEGATRVAVGGEEVASAIGPPLGTHRLRERRGQNHPWKEKVCRS